MEETTIHIIQELRRKGYALQPLIRVGKNGLTEGQLLEIKKMLKRKGLIKIKLLKAFFEGRDKHALGKEIAEKVNALLVQQIGNVVVLGRKKN